jgi:hypothetical protein
LEFRSTKVLRSPEIKIPRFKSGGTVGFGKRASASRNAITNKIFQKKRTLFSVVLVHKSFKYDYKDNTPVIFAAFYKKKSE